MIMLIIMNVIYNKGGCAVDMGKKIQDSYGLPIPVQRTLRKLGQDICDARRRRRIPAAILSERASISRTTLGKIEKGNSGVSMGNYATILFVLGLLDRLSDLADVRTDEVGLALEEEHLPRRIRASSANPVRAKK
jgi:transcriptional regulator with XRE-family HTH domain